MQEFFLPRRGWVGSTLGVGTVGLAFTFLFSACDTLFGDDDDNNPYVLFSIDGGSNDGNTNTFSPQRLDVVGDQVLVYANSAAWPLAAGATQGSWQQYDPDAFNNETRAGGNDLFRVTLPLDLNVFILLQQYATGVFMLTGGGAV